MDQVREKVLEDHRIMILEIVGEVGISTGSCHTILTEDLNLQRVSEGIVHLIPVTLCIMSMPQKARQSTKNTTWRFYIVFEMLFEESSQTCGQQRIFSSTTDNAPAHTAHVQAFLIKNNMPIVRRASYSPDFAPCDFWLFPKLKLTLKGGDFSPEKTL